MELVETGMVLGLGSGSTATAFIELLAERVAIDLEVSGVPTSKATEELARRSAIQLVSLEDAVELDLVIDGADEIDPSGNLIKGGGGALLREKVVASAGRRFVVIADAGKEVERLGAFPLPVDVNPFAASTVRRRIERMGVDTRIRNVAPQRPFVTDDGNWVLDCHFEEIDDPPRLSAILSSLPGVVEHGLFLEMADTILIGDGSKVRTRFSEFAKL